MIELFWIKSLLNFVVVCFSGLIIGILLNPKKKDGPRIWLLPIVFIFIIHFLGFLRFTTWINSTSSYIALVYDFCFVLNFILGPAILKMVKGNISRTEWLLHLIPAILSGGLFWSKIIPSEILLIASQLHFMGYISYILMLGKGNEEASSFSFPKRALGLWLCSYVLYFVELMFWSQLKIISETAAWGLFILAESILAFSLLYLIYQLATNKYRVKGQGQSKLPGEIMQRLQVEFTAYITQPSVYRDALISQQKVAKALNVSPYHVSRYLNHHYGESFLNVINSQRIEASKKILADSNTNGATIQEICYSVGFNSKSTFNTAFKKFTGLTPSQYREGCREIN